MKEQLFIKNIGEENVPVYKSLSNRNYGIDLLRIIAMFYVVLLHSLNKGGVLYSVIGNSTQYLVANFMDAWAYCAVDLFAIISGFVGFSETPKSTKASSYIKLWLQVVFYGVLITAIFKFINPDVVAVSDFGDMIMPVSNGLYWYFSAYTGLFLIMPFLDLVIRGCSQKQLKRMLIVIFIAFSCYESITYQLSMGGGYTVAWLVMLYIIGAIMKKCDIGKNINFLTALIGIIFLVGISWLWKIYSYNITFFGNPVDKNMLVSYTSPTILGAAMLYVIGFSKINFPKKIQKVIAFFAPATFAVYLLNNQRFIWSQIIEGRFIESAVGPTGLLIGKVLLFSLVFTIAAMLIDRLRILLFKILHVNECVDKFTKEIQNIFNRLGI